MHVSELWRYPVKSLAGETLEQACLLADGIEGDRVVRVEDEGGTVTALTKHDLVGIPVRLGDDGVLVDGQPWDGPHAAHAVRSAAGASVELVRTPGRRYDQAPLLVTTDGALDSLGEDRRRFRANVVLGGVDGLAERDWPGRELRMGGAVLSVSERCERCGVTTIDPDTLAIDRGVLKRLQADYDAFMGVLCEVLEPGDVAVGDPAELR